MKELRKLLSNIAGLAISVWFAAQIVMNPAASASIAVKVFWACIAFAIGAGIYDGIKRSL